MARPATGRTCSRVNLYLDPARRATGELIARHEFEERGSLSKLLNHLLAEREKVWLRRAALQHASSKTRALARQLRAAQGKATV